MKKNGYAHGKRRINSRTSLAQREDVIRRSVYVSDIDHQYIAISPNRFAEGARNALSMSGTMLGYYPVKVLPSKTAIVPVNPTFLPRVTQADVKLLFESLRGEVHRLRLLDDYHYATRIAFVEFVMADNAIVALNSGVVLVQ
ncbi:Polyadenylate-binding protein-interacting protein 11 [Striga hermonthica]|uniref:Polyadenylate-binding protein-interacting protein 11 n=1 Tax=Striga hermonthica TaxID=68872 RepID=A0A9N7P5K5_STRHE|nr:Polyadenylate-binding protein-interacting protein 11 [Striga hermonthica]